MREVSVSKRLWLLYNLWADSIITETERQNVGQRGIKERMEDG